MSFQANAKFFWQKPAAKKMKKYVFIFIKRRNGIHSAKQDEVAEIRDFC